MKVEALFCFQFDLLLLEWDLEESLSISGPDYGTTSIYFIEKFYKCILAYFPIKWLTLVSMIEVDFIEKSH